MKFIVNNGTDVNLLLDCISPLLITSSHTEKYPKNDFLQMYLVIAESGTSAQVF